MDDARRKSKEVKTERGEEGNERGKEAGGGDREREGGEVGVASTSAARVVRREWSP